MAVITNPTTSGTASPLNPSPIARAAARYAAKRSASPSALGVGDSYAVGAGATGSVGYLQLLATQYASQASWINYGWAGYPLTKYSSAPLNTGTGAATSSQFPIALDTVSCSIIGLNDLRGVGQDSVAITGCGPNPDNYYSLRSKVQAMATHFLIPEVNKVRAQNIGQTALNPALSFTGSWTRGLNGNTAFIYTTNAGDSISGTTAVGNLLVIRMGSGVAETTNYIDVVIDGVTYPRAYHRAAYDGWAQDCIIIPLPTVAAHTFSLTARLPGGGASVFESIDCVDTRQDFSATFFYSTALYLNDGANVGWGLTGITANSASVNLATGGLAWSYGNGASDRFEAAIDMAMNELYALGFNVVKVDCKTGWKKDVMLAADTIHPNDQGHGHLKNCFARQLNKLYLQY